MLKTQIIHENNNKNCVAGSDCLNEVVSVLFLSLGLLKKKSLVNKCLGTQSGEITSGSVGLLFLATGN